MVGDTPSHRTDRYCAAAALRLRSGGPGVLAVTDSPAGLGTSVVAPVAQCGHEPVRLIRPTPPTRPTGRTRHPSGGRVAGRRWARGRGSRPGARPQSFASETSRSPVLRQVTLA